MTLKHGITVAALAGLAVLIGAQISFCQPGMETEQKIRDLVGRMTLEEKVTMLGGSGFETKPIARLGIPALNMTDGPLGVRWGRSTAFPASIASAATWDPELIQKDGAALGREAKAKGRHMLLAPCININREPQGGRNFESFGEDPYLTSRMAVAYVKGVQSEKVVACTKHYAANNQEWERESISVNVDERILREIYLPAFKAAVQEGGCWTVMSAYNKLNGTWCSENPWLLNDVLKREWGFAGFVVSDWGAVHSMVPTANAGLDLEMPTGKYLNADLLEAVRKGQVQESTIDDKITRLLRVMQWVGLLDGKNAGASAPLDMSAQSQTALDVAREGIVLLKNDGNVLPLDRSKIRSIAVIGPNAATARTGGGGSSQVEPVSSVSPLEGLRSKAGTSVQVVYARGCLMEGDLTPIGTEFLRPPAGGKQTSGLKAEYFDNADLRGLAVVTRIDPGIDFDWGDDSPMAGIPKDGFSVRWTGELVPKESGKYLLSVRTDDGVRLFLDGKLLVDNWSNHAPETRSVSIALQAGKAYPIRMEYYENTGGAVARLGWRMESTRLLGEAVAAARSCDVAVVFAGLSSQFESEGFDRQTLSLPAGQDELIEAVVRENKKTVVVLNAGAPVIPGNWLGSVPALVLMWYPGQEGGTAIAEVLLGDVNPSGKLPVTFLKNWEDSPAFGNYPGGGGKVDYREGIFVGYRHFDRSKTDVLFPFGHGLSYSSFEYKNLSVSPANIDGQGEVQVTLDVKNVSGRDGAEIVQMYIRDVESSVPRPIKELKGFARVLLKAGESKKVAFFVNRDALSFFHPGKKQWTVEPGKFELLIGSSSRDIRLTGSFNVQ